MKTVTYKKTGYYSKTVTDYLSQNEQIKEYYGLYPTKENFKKQIAEKSKTKSNRKTLVEVLTKQYKNIPTSKKTAQNIQQLLQENTYTITTGHQLNLYTGPLYFLYKIITTINLCETLKADNPEQNFVPIYWMATEDHDFEEIQYFNIKNEKIIWDRKSTGAVGRLKTKSLETVLEKITKQFGTSINGKRLIKLFKDSYLENDTLSEATRYLTNELFKEYGLVIIDADNSKLKREFIPIAKEELQNQTAYKEITKTNKTFGKKYKIQVNPREINLFYLTNEIRERIILENKTYKINNTNIKFTKEEIQTELQKHPERFSPNVIMRPLYQEVILPNLAYIGGGGEIAYWLELKAYFKKMKVAFPILLLRNSALIMSEKQEGKLKKLKISKQEIFLKQHKLITKKITEKTNINLDFSKLKEQLEKQFSEMRIIAAKTDKTFIGAVKAQEKKQVKGLKNLEKRLLKAEKRKLNDIVERITEIQNQLFPKQNLQERYTNFSEMYLEFGEQLIPKIKKELKPLKLEFSVITI